MNKFILHLLVFLILHIVGGLNLITDFYLDMQNPKPTLESFSYTDFFSSYAILYICQYLLVALMFFSTAIYVSFKISHILSKKLTQISPHILHSTIALIICSIIISLNKFYFPDSNFISLFILSTSWQAILCISLLVILISIVAYTQLKKTATVILIVIAISQLLTFKDTYTPDPSKPDIILIGIDSLRTELIKQEMPFLYNQLQKSFVFDNAYTAFARTYPSWMSILTGQQPSQNGARYNLQSEAQLNANNQYLPAILSQHGYHTVYASDERRFSNIGEYQGFEQVIGPRTGASDFILGNYADFPITNLLTLLPISNWLLPELYANRAASHLYKPSAFSHLLSTYLTQLPKQPLFLSTHFCLPHWPYVFLGHQVNAGYPDSPVYPSALKATDNQIKALFFNLEKAGRLHNSRIIFLSDHGESWGQNHTGLMGKKGELIINDHGHGMNILSPASHKVLLALQHYPSINAHSERLVSLADIFPTILDELNLPAIEISGQSLLRPAERPVTIGFESGVILSVANVANPGPEKVAQAGAFRFHVTPTGHLRLKQSLINSMIENKQIGVRVEHQGLFKMRQQDPFKLIDYDQKTFQEIDELNEAPQHLKKQFCDLFSHSNGYLKKICGT